MSTTYVIDAPQQASVGVVGSGSRFPLRRVFCVGRNYAAHAREMGNDPDREPPFFFMKPADAVVPAEGVVPYPPQTRSEAEDSIWPSPKAVIAFSSSNGGFLIQERLLHFAPNARNGS